MTASPNSNGGFFAGLQSLIVFFLWLVALGVIGWAIWTVILKCGLSRWFREPQFDFRGIGIGLFFFLMILAPLALLPFAPHWEARGFMLAVLFINSLIVFPVLRWESLSYIEGILAQTAELQRQYDAALAAQQAKQGTSDANQGRQ